VWKEAFAAKLLEGDADSWSEAQQMRNLTVHTYDEIIAEQVHKFVRYNAIELLQKLKAKAVTWQIQT
jgi:uncharacterized protein with HEPN domain